VAEPLTLWRWLGLALVFGALGVAWWWAVKRSGGVSFLRKTAGRMEVKDRVLLEARTGLVLVECDGQPYLVAYSPGGVSLEKLARPQQPLGAPEP